MEIDQKVVDDIKNMSRYDMCKLHRFAPAGHIYFDSTLPYNKIFQARFAELGGFNPEISKQLGWDS